MKAFRKIVLITCLALYTVFISLRQPDYFHGVEYEVRVKNGFRRNSSMPLIVWCSSPPDDIDLGGRALQEGEDFSWGLRASFWRAARFLCTVKWDRRRRSFDAFRVRRDGHRCFFLKKCFWLVREDGIYFSNNEVSWKKGFAWA